MSGVAREAAEGPARRSELIDAIRGISILLVLILHFQLAYRLDEGFLFGSLPRWLARPLLGNGNYGVTMFFVVSGYLITSRTLARWGGLGRVDPIAFYRMRFARIAPNITLMLALVLGLGAAGIGVFKNSASGPPLWLTVASVLTFTHNLLMERYGYFNYCLNILWSLSVEEVFYLGFPLLCLGLRRTWLIAAACVLFVAIAPVYRHLHRGDPSDIFVLYDSLACFDGIAIGCLAAILRKPLASPGWAGRLRIPAALGAAAIYFSGGILRHAALGISGVALCIGVILMVARENDRDPGHPLLRPLIRLGERSYELYLFHIVLLALMKTALPRAALGYYAKPAALLAFLVVSERVARFVGLCYSEPLNRLLRGRRFPAPPLAVAARGVL